jgi:hypothetical protein
MIKSLIQFPQNIIQNLSLFNLICIGLATILVRVKPQKLLAVAMVGALATWWVGLLMAIVLGVVGLQIKDHQQRTKKIITAFIIELSITFIAGLIGLVFGQYFLNTQNTNWYMPDNLVNRNNFIAVGSMHNFGYIGAAVGLVVGVVYLMSFRKLSTTN